LPRRPSPAQLLEPGSPGPDRLELETVALAEGSKGRLQPLLGRPDQGQQALGGGGARLQPPAALGSLTALVGMPGQAALDLLEPLIEDPTALDQPGGAHLPLVAQP